jgi:membrane protease YdiL (CAAX protease family)
MVMSNRWLISGIVIITAATNLSEIWVTGPLRWLVLYLAFAALALVAYQSNIAWSDIGLARRDLRSGLYWGLGAAAVIAVVLLAANALDHQAFTDSRYLAGWRQTLVTVLFTIPLKTVLFEEFLFRGVLLAALNRVGSGRWRYYRSVALSSLCFGLWHIVSSANLYATSHQLGSATAALGSARLGGIVLAVAATSLFGAALCWLRLRSKSLLAPILAHWSINAFSVLLIAWSVY